MGLLKQGRRIARAAAYVANAGDGGGLLVIAPSAAAPGIADLTGVRVGEATPEGAIIIHALEGSEDRGRVIEALAAHRSGDVDAVVVLIGTPHEREAHERALLATDHIGGSRIVHVASLDEDGGEALRRRLITAVPGEVSPLAGRYPLLRPAALDDIVGRSSILAAGAAAVRGAGMPVLTILQVRMLADLAVGHGKPMGPNRAADVAAVVAAGFVWRLVGRTSLGLFSTPAWLVRGGIAWLGTQALGAAVRRRLDAAEAVVPIGRPDSPGLPGRRGGS